MLNWAKQFGTFCFLDNHQYQIKPHAVECLLAAGVKRSISLNAGTALEQLQGFLDEKHSWLFGHLGYDLKNEIEELSSANASTIKFPDLFFFEPEVVIKLSEKEIFIEAIDPKGIFKAISEVNINEVIQSDENPLKVESRLSKEEYISTIKKLQQHIVRGDCYEINFCQEFYATNAVIDPVDVYQKLSNISPNPFSALYRMNNQWLICASPERYIKKSGSNILSQPIKGTSIRIRDNDEKDGISRLDLFNSAKDRSENVMVVDLVRNDLAKICEEGSVKVDELYGIYSFPQVHQMISTVSGTLKSKMPFAEIIKATFPMGSMTGAPKKRVMALIEEYEQTKRGIFSGAVGYINPYGDFDFNVVIRSILYNASAKYISLPAGSAITFYSDPEKEWEECLMKAEAMKNVLE
ncbi:MAG: anthranilate synthase component I family protein [Chitinophagaceae bacterium]|nr:anthranilate synthase component I family protein [Chitinophagaceae bacterium]